ncbi:MAG: WYL domain-containing protein [Bacteroidales bacterium]|nr:WYL domain-containing protein [Bacteroidales bacterium]
MPVDRQVLIRYRVLNRCFRNAHREYDIAALLDSVNRELEKYDCQPISERTLRVDIQRLQEPPYHIELDESLKSGKRRLYRYSDVSFSLPMVTLDDEEKEMLKKTIGMLSQYDDIPQYQWMLTLLSQIENGNGWEGGKRFVEFQNNADLVGIGHFQALLGAIINNQPLTISYKPFGKPERSMNIHPYYLKQYNDRWFLVAQTEGFDDLSVLAIDRIDSIKTLHIPFIESNVDMEDYFGDSVGVTVFPDRPIEEVRLRVDAKRYPYMATKPIHWSQTELKDEATEEYKVVRLNVRINNELESAILSFGDDVEVLAPESLRLKIGENIERLAKKYKYEEKLQS